MIYLANPCGSPAVVDRMTAGDLGFIATPAQGNRRPAGAAWAADNGCFGKGYPGDDAWFAWLSHPARLDARDTCLFAVAPDVVADHAATLKRSLPWLPAIRELGYPAAFVAQNGATPTNLPWDDFDVLFVGGDTEWKLGPVARACVLEAKRRGKHVHMGRVNSRKRYQYAAAIGCDSVDGTFLTWSPDFNLSRLMGWTEQAVLNLSTAAG